MSALHGFEAGEFALFAQHSLAPPFVGIEWLVVSWLGSRLPHEALPLGVQPGQTLFGMRPRHGAVSGAQADFLVSSSSRWVRRLSCSSVLMRSLSSWILGRRSGSSLFAAAGIGLSAASIACSAR